MVLSSLSCLFFLWTSKNIAGQELGNIVKGRHRASHKLVMRSGVAETALLARTEAHIFPPPNTLSNFACSVSSLSRCSLHYRPGLPEVSQGGLAVQVLGQRPTIDTVGVRGVANALPLHRPNSRLGDRFVASRNTLQLSSLHSITIFVVVDINTTYV
jgi:hypothetical protein